jgi:Carboxypeptidase regulatory-like domain
MRAKNWVVFEHLMLLAVVAVTPLAAQGDRGEITGTVVDASGAVVPTVQITATQTATNTTYKTVSNTVGDFTIPSLPVGLYQVKAEAPGFKTLIVAKVEITPGATARVDLKLDVGTAQQSVEVTANTQVLQTENARVATEVSNTLVDALPVQVNGNSRSPFDLASTTGEVNAAGTFRIGGGNDTVGITLDGSSLAGDKIGNDAGNGGAAAMNSPSVEALTEFTVETSGFKAETGNASGGTLSFVSKSGTNRFHGSTFEFLRNQDLDAKGFFNSVKPIYKQNNFGATAGGPVYLPKLYNGKNKTFFFASYEGFRNRVGAGNGTFSSVPPPEFYTGDLHNWVNASGVMYPIYDPGSQVANANGTTDSAKPIRSHNCADFEVCVGHPPAEPSGNRAGDFGLLEQQLL